MSTILKDTFHPRLLKAVKEQNNSNLIIRNVKRYIDTNNEVLYDSGPNNRLFMDDKDREFIFKIADTTEKELKDLFKKIDDIDEKWTIVTPFNILDTLMIREYDIAKNDKARNMLIIMLALSLYSSLQYKYFRFLPNKAAMEYTINNMTNKYLIKKYAVLYKAIEHIAIKNHETYAKDLISGTDLDIKNYIMNLRTRLNNFVKIIASEYMENLNNKKYLNVDEDNRSEENFVMTSNISLKLEQYVMSVSNKFYSTSINPKLSRVASSWSNVHGPTLEMALKTLKDAEDKRVTDLIRYILKIFFSNKANSLEAAKSRKFIQYLNQIYSKSNIRDEDVIAMKKLLDDFLSKYCDRYISTEREATKVMYRKALFYYFVLLINTTMIASH